MAQVLTKNSTLTCGPPPHGGTISVSPTAKLRVDNASVLVKSDVVNASISGCGAQTMSTAACTSVASVLTKESTKLTVNGVPVLIDLTGTTAPATSTGPLLALPVQTKLKAT